MGAYEDMVLQTLEAVLRPGERMTTEALMPRIDAYWVSRDVRVLPVDVRALTAVLRASPDFVEVQPGTWMRRHDRPEAGRRSRLRRPPFAGGAAAAVPLPAPAVSLDVVGGAGGKASISRPATG
ncbi:MAG TPA: hypothetical protein VOB72_02375 [Candidatus Dormibacteraeota bacterium]|nr:hypothetical protein [Candidatus Dormibacteraeota bacterium]